MAIYFDVRLQCKDSSATREALGVQFEKELKESTSHLATVLLEEWPPRFNEIEWPTTVWLNWITEFGLYLGIDVWPCKISKGYRVAEIRFGELHPSTFSKLAFFFGKSPLRPPTFLHDFGLLLSNDYRYSSSAWVGH